MYEANDKIRSVIFLCTAKTCKVVKEFVYKF